MIRRLAAPLATLSLLVACDGPDTDCVARGSSTAYAGSASYTGQTQEGSSTTPLTGSTAAGIVVYDASGSCTYDGMQFLVAVGACQLWATLTTSSDEGGSGFAASIQPGQPCPLNLAAGPATMTVASGELSVADDTTLTLAGVVALATDAGETSDAAGGAAYLQWSFQGQ